MKIFAEPISGLDERFISSVPAERSFHNASVIRVAGSGDLRLSAGPPNMHRIAAEIEAWSLRLPRLRQRLMHSPAGLMAPAWVPETGFRTEDHLRLHPVGLAESDVTPAIQNGDANGPLDMRKSPWNALVVDLVGGDLLLIIKMHHVMGDGLSGVSTLDALLTDSPEERPEPPAVPAARAPANPLELFGAVWDGFCSANPTWDARRSAAFAKPPLVRLRKVVGRNLRHLRSRSAGGQQPRRQYGVMSADLKTAQISARRLGGSLTDLVATAAAHGVAEAQPGRHSRAVTIAVPVSRKPDHPADMGNRTRIVPVTLMPGPDTAASVASVRAQSRAAVESGRSAHLSQDAWDAMATFLPAGFRPRYFAGQTVRNILYWTSLDPSERIGILSSNYLRTLNVTVVASPEVNMEALLAALGTVLGDAGALRAAVMPMDQDPGTDGVLDSLREGAA